MSMSIADLTVEIKAIITKGIGKGKAMPAPWIVTAVLAKHPVVYDPDKIGTKKCDSDYAELARHELAKMHVRRVLRLFKKPEPEDIPKLPGFERLLTAYLIVRDEKPDGADDDADELSTSMIVPIEQMTDDELKAKAAEYRAIGKGCYEHADELDRYTRERKKAAA